MTFQALKTRVNSLIKRAKTSLAMRDTGNFPVVQVSYYNHAGLMEVIEPYGLCSSPPIGSLALLLAINGQEENRAGFATLPLQRFKNLQPGEVQVGNYLTQASVLFKANGDIVINGPDNAIATITKDLDVTVGGNANITITGNATLTVGGTTLIDCPTTHMTGTLRVDGAINGGDGGTFTGDVRATGDILDQDGSNVNHMRNMRTIYNGHVHPDPQGGNTSATTQTQ